MFNVIKSDISGFYSNYNRNKDIVPLFTERVRKELMRAFPNCGIQDSDTMERCIGRVFASTGEQFVVILDEYDVLVREQVNSSIFAPYLAFLNGMFKIADLAPAFALVYLTGDLPIVRDKIQSKLNLFTEYTMTKSKQLTEFVEFTEEETHHLCEQYQLDYEECRRWYDGYAMHYHDKSFDLYNSKSVVQAMVNKEFDDYWPKTGSYKSIKIYISMNFDGIKDDVKAMIAGEHIDVNIKKYMNTMTDFNSKDDVYTYLIHLGYLAYDRIERQCYIPNHEIRTEWIIAIEDNPDYTEAIRIVNNSKILLDKTVEGDAQAVAEALSAADMRGVCRQA